MTTNADMKDLRSQSIELRRLIDASLKNALDTGFRIPENLRNALVQARNTAENLQIQIEREAALRGNPFPKIVRG